MESRLAPAPIRKPRGQRGMTLIELMIAGVVLAVGMAGLALLFSASATSVNRTKLDSGATLVAKAVLEQIAAQDPSLTTAVDLKDCSGTTWSVNTAGGATVGTSAGANINTTSSSVFYGGIDFTQNYSAVTTGYKMLYKDCGTDVNQTGGFTTYDVRWNVTTLSIDTSNSVRTRMIVVAAKQNGVKAGQLGGMYFAIPVTLRAIGGPLQ